MEPSRLRCVILLVTSLSHPGTGYAPGVMASGGNSAAARRCQHGGWEDLQETDGTTFASQGECVRFAAHGGTLESRLRTMTVSFLQGSLEDMGNCGILVEDTGFSSDTYDLLITSEQEPDYPTLIEVEADGMGWTQTVPRTSSGEPCGLEERP